MMCDCDPVMLSLFSLALLLVFAQVDAILKCETQVRDGSPNSNELFELLGNSFSTFSVPLVHNHKTEPKLEKPSWL